MPDLHNLEGLPRDNRPLIIDQALKSLRLATTYQLALLTDWDKHGNPKPPILMKSHQYPGSLDDTGKILRSRESAEDAHGNPKAPTVKRYPNRNPYEKRIWTRIDEPFVSDQMIPHELDLADLFSGFYLACGVDLRHWDWCRADGEDYDSNLYPLWDVRLVYRRFHLRIEQDNGTESPETLEDKVDRYCAYFRAFPEYPFTVIFSMKYMKDNVNLTPEQRQRRAASRANRLLKYIAGKPYADRFYLAWTERLKATPLGEVLVSPLDPRIAISLSVLAS